MSKDQDKGNDDAACGKIWEIYVREAQQYDEGMIRSWKEDMDNMLVFSGLYSAILTAFVIESYQNLQPDLTQDSSALLRRISEQLAASSTLSPIPDPSSFTPTTAALTCNILWFISLALALTCSFLATLVQQWSRRFLHRTSTVRSPGAHAHLLQFLYFGLKDLRMHAMVELIPSLLHLSLFSFFGGLIGFLHDVNDVITWICIAVLSLLLLLYVALTVFPLIKLDSPYSTPMSSLLWHIFRICGRIRELTPVLSISPLVRRLKSIRVALPPGHSSTDEEAQREPHVDSHGSNGEETVILSSSTLEWSLSDATVRASRVRRPEHESRGIAWLLRSLNDDLELLPLVEALPNALQYKADGDLRETNFHLLEALIAPTDPQANIVLRILDLMENARHVWHTKLHQERCAIASARALWALGRLVSTNNARFRPMTHSTPLFTVEVIDRIGKCLSNGALERSYGQSALVMCIFSSCLWLKDRLMLTPDDTAVTSSVAEQASKIDNIRWGKDFWRDINTPLRLGHNYVGMTKKLDVDGVIARLLEKYTMEAIESYPENFQFLSELILGSEVKHLSFNFECSGVLKRLWLGMFSRRSEVGNKHQVDTIFYLVIRLAAHEDEARPSRTCLLMLSRCISLYNDIFGWGGSSLFGNLDILPSLLKCLLLQKSEYPSEPLGIDYLDTLRHLFGYHIDLKQGGEIIYSFWTEIFQGLHQPFRQAFLKESSAELSLTYLIALQVSDSGSPRRSTSSEGNRRILLLDQVYERVSREQVLPNTTRHHLHWITLLQCLGSDLPVTDTLYILKFFHARRLASQYQSVTDILMPFLKLFIRYSEEYYFKLIDSSKSESIRLNKLLEINGMIWAIWEHLVDKFPPVETFEDCQLWYNAFSLLKTVDDGLTPEIRQLSQATVVQPLSIKNPSSAILLPREKYERDKRGCLDLPARVEATKNKFTGYIHLFTTLPDSSAEEDQLLSMDDDDTYSNRHPFNRDRLAAHYFVPLPPADDEEDTALSHPHSEVDQSRGGI